MIKENLCKKIAEMSVMSDAGRELLFSCAQQMSFAKGECLLAEGQISKHLYFVEKGRLHTYFNGDAKDIMISFTLEGNFTGNINSLKKEQPSQYIIETGENSVITLFEKNHLLKLYSQSSEIELLCRKILGTFLLESNEQIDFFKLHTPMERYNFLVKNKPEMIKKIPVSQLASYLGVARETLSRIRKR
jgi:CRP-like cAMP-binding protein